MNSNDGLHPKKNLDEFANLLIHEIEKNGLF